MKSSLADVAAALSNAVLINTDSSTRIPFSGVAIDSRKIEHGNLFVALRGEQFDAHSFLQMAVDKDAAAVMVEKLPENFPLPALVVPDTRIALGELAKFWRQKFSLPVIAVTGSNGKTTVKEMIASILKAAFGKEAVLGTTGNLNNEIGAPLTLLKLEQNHRAAVIEIGMNHPGEMAPLTKIVQPTVALVNNAQREHQEFMLSIEAVAQENGMVIANSQPGTTAVFPADDTYAPLWRSYAAKAGLDKVITFSATGTAEISCDYQLENFSSNLKVRIGARAFVIHLGLAGLHNVQNALAAIACTATIGVSDEAIVQGLESFSAINGRLQRKTSMNGALVIDDTYNANPDSIRAAIDVLAKAATPKVLVLGDMGEVGSNGPEFHTEIGAYARERAIDYLFTLGELTRGTSEAFGTSAQHYQDIQELNKAVKALLSPAVTVLVKGSRFMKMERVVHYLLDQPVQDAH